MIIMIIYYYQYYYDYHTRVSRTLVRCVLVHALFILRASWLWMSSSSFSAFTSFHASMARWYIVLAVTDSPIVGARLSRVSLIIPQTRSPNYRHFCTNSFCIINYGLSYCLPLSTRMPIVRSPKSKISVDCHYWRNNCTIFLLPGAFLPCCNV